MKTIFFVGKGGVGKSTLSATAARQLAAAGQRVFVFSLDPAHNLGDIYGVRLTDRKKRIEERLDAAEADLDRAASEYLRTNMEILTRVYSYTKAFNLDLYFKVLRYSPGVEEYAALTVLEEVLRTETDYDYLVFDTPPTGLTLRILALPRVAVEWIDRMRRVRGQILKKRYTIHHFVGGSGERSLELPYREEDDEVTRQLTQLASRYGELNAKLKSSTNSIAVVFNPDYLSLKESERIIAGLTDLELPIRAAFDNKYAPEQATTADRVEKTLFDGMVDVPVIRVPYGGHLVDGAHRMEFNIAETFRN